MSAKTDYTPVILAQLTDLATRVTQLEATNATLRAEVTRLTQRNSGGFGFSGFATSDSAAASAPASASASASATAPRGFGGFPLSATDGFSFGSTGGKAVQTSIPLAPATGGFQFGARTENSVPQLYPRYTRANGSATGASAAASAAPQKEYKPLTIQDVLHLNETVTVEVGIGKDETGNFLQASCITVFDGVTLTVNACELVPSLVGMSTTKPGEILYRFIEGLKDGGHIKKTFTIAPWRLCFVVRDGKKMSLEDLRSPL